MLEKIAVLPNRAIVKILKEEKKGELTASGIFIPSTTRIQYSTKLREAEIMLVSDTEENFKVGDKVLIEGAGVKIKYNGEDCININCHEDELLGGQILAIINT